MSEKYYLAYGSNLNVKQMRSRCPCATPIGTAEIPDYELLYKGSKTGAYLTIEQKEGCSVSRWACGASQGRTRQDSTGTKDSHPSITRRRFGCRYLTSGLSRSRLLPASFTSCTSEGTSGFLPWITSGSARKGTVILDSARQC